MISTKDAEFGTFGITFANSVDADAFYDRMKARGYTEDEISILMTPDTKQHAYSGDAPVETVQKSAAEKTVIGSGIGGTVGAIAGVLATLGTNAVIPGLGLVVAGPIIGALAGAGAGGATGALIGALTSIGVPEEYAKIYHKELHAGKTVVLMNPKNANEINYLNENMETIHGENLMHWNS